MNSVAGALGTATGVYDARVSIYYAVNAINDPNVSKMAAAGAVAKLLSKRP